MNKLLLTSLACLGLAGAATSRAQNTSGPYNPDPSSQAGFPLFVSNLFADSISSIGQAGGATNPNFVTTGVPQPVGLATNGSGNIYVTAGAGTSFGVSQFNAATGAVQSFSQTLPFSPQGLTFGPDGFLYATTNASSVARIDPATGAFTNIVASTAGNAGALFASSGITFGPDGNIYVANPTNNLVARVNPANGNVTTLALAGVSGPTDLVFDHNTLLVTNHNTSTITGYLLAGGNFTFSLIAQNQGIDLTLNGPEGITIGPDGKVYVANDFSNANGVSNIDQIGVTRGPTGEIIALSPATVFATQDSSLGTNFVVFVPEPSTYVLFGVSGVVLTVALLRCRRMPLRA